MWILHRFLIKSDANAISVISGIKYIPRFIGTSGFYWLLVTIMGVEVGFGFEIFGIDFRFVNQ